jgi:hypothetical protein
MSLRNRARSLQQKTGLSYQQALAKLRALGERPATLSKQSGWPLEVCDRFLVDGHAPIDVIEVAAPQDPIAQVCETLLATTNARAVVVSAENGRILAHVGTDQLEAMWRGHQPGRSRPVELPDVWELDAGLVLYTARFKGGMIVVKFQRDETSLGLVKLRTAKAIEDLERLFRQEKEPGMPPTGGGGGRGGIPAEVRVVRETRAAPPEPKRKPIGRKKKR